jgi:hypothetical protein
MAGKGSVPAGCAKVRMLLLTIHDKGKFFSTIAAACIHTLPYTTLLQQDSAGALFKGCGIREFIRCCNERTVYCYVDRKTKTPLAWFGPWP